MLDTGGARVNDYVDLTAVFIKRFNYLTIDHNYNWTPMLIGRELVKTKVSEQKFSETIHYIFLFSFLTVVFVIVFYSYRTKQNDKAFRVSLVERQKARQLKRLQKKGEELT